MLALPSGPNWGAPWAQILLQAVQQLSLGLVQLGLSALAQLRAVPLYPQQLGRKEDLPVCVGDLHLHSGVGLQLLPRRRLLRLFSALSK